MVNWVRQEDDHGCGLACFAMLTNRTYAEAKSIFPEQDWGRKGVSHFEVDRWLAEDGVAVARRYEPLSRAPRAGWPVEPFGDVHLVTAQSPLGSHFVVLLKDGTVLDPIDPQPRRLEDYTRIFNIAAVTPICG